MTRTIHLNLISAAVASLLLSFAPSSLSAAPFVVNFDVDINAVSAGGNNPGTYSGVGAAPDTGTYWNSANGGTSGSTNPITSSGTIYLSDGSTTTTVGLSVDNGYGYASGTNNAMLDDWATQAASHVGNFSLTNVPAGNYDVYVYAVNGDFHDVGTIVTVTGGTADGGIDRTVNTTDSTYSEGDNYVLFRGVTVGSGGGTISGTYAPNPNTSEAINNLYQEADFNGIQLVQVVPEPSSLVLGGLAGLGLLAVVRRRRVLRND